MRQPEEEEGHHATIMAGQLIMQQASRELLEYERRGDTH